MLTDMRRPSIIKWEAKNRDTGKCIRCGKEARNTSERSPLCAYHLEYARKWKATKDAKRKEDRINGANG